jgi:hypothetical protein
MMDAVDEAIFDWIDCDVYQFRDCRLAVEQPCHAWFFTRPKVLATTSEHVLAAREHFVKVLHERRVPAMPIENLGVVVIRLRVEIDDVDLEPLRRLRQAVHERIVRLAVRSQQELALRAPSRDEMKLSWKNLSRQTHAARWSNMRAITASRPFFAKSFA